MSFSSRPLSVSKEKDSFFYRGREEKEREREKKAILEIVSISQSHFLVLFLHNLTTSDRIGCLSI